jgi:hypothetical protein
MNYKKSIKLLSFFIVMFLLTQSSRIVYAKNIYKDNISYEDKQRAINKHDKFIHEDIKTLINCKKDIKPEKKITIKNDKGDNYQIPMYLIDESELFDDYGNLLNIEAATYAFSISSEVFSESELTSTSALNMVANSFGSGNKYKDLYDGTSSVLGYTTIYYSTTPYPETDVYTLTKVTGGYAILDAGTRVVSQLLAYGEFGIGISGLLVNPSNIKIPTTSSWSYNTNYLEGVLPGGSWNIGSTYTMTLQHGTSSKWSLQIVNQLPE